MKISLFVVLSVIAINLYSLSDISKKYHSIPYEVGDTLPDSITIDSSAKPVTFEPSPDLINTTMYYPSSVNGIKCYFVFDNARIINNIFVLDRDFMSPEGLSIGDPISDALQYSDSNIILIGTQTVMCELPSGWLPCSLTRCGSMGIIDGLHTSFPPCDSMIRDTSYLLNRKIEFFMKIPMNARMPRDDPRFNFIKLK